MAADFLDDGGPAFPCDPFIASRPSHESVAKRLAEGMSLRDFFAAEAIESACRLEESSPTGPRGEPAYAAIGTRAYLIADAMLKARVR